VIPRVVMRARLPVSVFWLITSGLALLGTLGGLSWLTDSERRRELPATEPAV